MTVIESDSTSDPTHARVASLDCARAEDTMAEGTLEGFALEHVSRCVQCRELAELLELTGKRPGLVTATAPAPLPAGFIDSVLDRAFDATHPLDRIRPATDDLRVAELEAALSARRQRTRWIAVGALAAGLLLAAGVSSVWDRAKTTDSLSAAPAMHRVVAKGDYDPSSADPVTVATAPTTQAPTQAPQLPPTAIQASGVGTSGSENTAPLPAVKSPAAASVEPTPKPKEVPEAMLDIPAEIRALLVQKMRLHKQCPKRNTAPVRVTLTVATDGTVSSPQVLSSSGHAAAHQCVSYALDRLLLPPLQRSVTVTLDLTW